MRVEIDLPDWCDERDIHIMAGVELVAYKKATESTFHLKTTRCNMCGECCINYTKGTPYFPFREDGSCSKLGEDGPTKKPCTMGIERPYPCTVADPVMFGGGKDYCSIRYDNEE